MKPVIQGNQLIDTDTGEVLVQAQTNNPDWNQSIIEYSLYKIDVEEWFQQCIRKED